MMIASSPKFVYKVVRDVSTDECPWLSNPLTVGEKLYLFTGATYGAIGDGVALTREVGKTPFFEVPRDAVVALESNTNGEGE